MREMGKIDDLWKITTRKGRIMNRIKKMEEDRRG